MRLTEDSRERAGVSAPVQAAYTQILLQVGREATLDEVSVRASVECLGREAPMGSVLVRTRHLPAIATPRSMQGRRCRVAAKGLWLGKGNCVHSHGFRDPQSPSAAYGCCLGESQDQTPGLGLTSSLPAPTSSEVPAA